MSKRILTVVIIALCAVNIIFFYLLNDDWGTAINFRSCNDEVPLDCTVPTEIPEAMAGEILYVDDSCLNPSFPVSLSYDKYPSTYRYMYIESENINVHAGPSAADALVRQANPGERFCFLEAVYIAGGGGKVERWYHVYWDEGGEKHFGFVEDTDVIERSFQFDKIEAAIIKAENYASRGRLTYISNYQNRNGYPPLYKGKATDGQGGSRSQSAPGYPSINNKEDFVYIEDGTLIRQLFTHDEYVKIQLVHTGEIFHVPQKYIASDHRIHDLKKVIAIDVTNQNEAVYEKKIDGWTLISYTFATTGTQGPYSQPTPLGYFFAMEKKPYFRYYEDGTTRIQGYAPYVIRFAGGAYVHGIGVNYEYAEDGTTITPPTVEYSKTIGTKALSHKCVRNYTSHAKFLYDWFVAGETIVIVID